VGCALTVIKVPRRKQWLASSRDASYASSPQMQQSGATHIVVWSALPIIIIYILLVGSCRCYLLYVSS